MSLSCQLCCQLQTLIWVSTLVLLSGGCCSSITSLSSVRLCVHLVRVVLILPSSLSRSCLAEEPCVSLLLALYVNHTHFLLSLGNAQWARGLQLVCTQSVFCERMSKHQAVHVGSLHTAVPKIMSGSVWNVSLFISWGSVGERNGVLGSFEHS